MSKIRRFVTAATLAACALAPAVAMAQSILFLSTAESTTDNYYSASIKNFQEYFGISILDRSDKLTNSTISAADFNGIDIVLVATGKKDITSANYTVLEEQMKTNHNLGFIIFSDGCSDCGNGLSNFSSTISSATSMSLGTGPYKSTAAESLNTSSIYQSYFSGRDPIYAEYYSTISGASDDNWLYGDSKDSALAIFVPRTQMNAGKGACIFMASDLTLWKNSLATTSPPPGRNQGATLASTLLGAVQPGGAACNVKPSGGGTAAPVPTTGWPALLGLSALLPLLAVRRRRRK